MTWDSPDCSMCHQRRRTIHKFGQIWRICVKCDGGLEVSPNDDGGTSPPGENASV